MNLRLTVQQWGDGRLYGYATHDPAQQRLAVAYGLEWRLDEQLYPQATLNLLDAEADADGTLHPALIILEPDYLIDITTVCQCVKPCGATPLHYLLPKFMPREETLAIQLGNAANQFLDDIVNGNTSFLASMQKSFRDYPLAYCTLPGVDKHFFAQCRAQHDHLQEVVREQFPREGIDVEHDRVQLEPSFICEPLGLQGRMDLLAGDLEKIVELKSGKQDEFYNTFKTEHAWQMALYREILHYSLGRERETVKTLLLYSKYPRLYNIHLGRETTVAALAVRNGIVHIDRMLRERCKPFLLSLREEDFNPLHSQGKFYQNYVRPGIVRFLDTLHGASPLALDYFCTMVAFVQREQYLAKVGDGRPACDRAFARSWLCDAESKRLDGSMLADLSLTPVLNALGMLTHVEALLPPGKGNESNFREGDSVVLYERNGETDLMTNRQSVRCYVERLLPDRLVLQLGYPQRGTSFLRPGSLYAIEPSHSDSLFATQYRGLFALLSCPEERRQLLLAQRPPVAGQDYYLLVGPPGSGKTSMALRQRVTDFLHDAPSGESILLMAYTNRAVDEICQMLEGLNRDGGGETADTAYVRIGQELSCAPAYRPRLMGNLIADCRNREETLQRLRPLRIVCGTVASIAGATELFRLKHFHTAILDEASQVLEPQLMPLLCAPIGRFVLIGDHKQLPAVVVQQPEESRVAEENLRDIGLLNCRDSLFERLYRLVKQNGYEGVDGMLERQGRMHEEISRFVNRQYYGGRLGIVPLPHQTAPLPWAVYDSQDPMQAVLARRRMCAFDVVPAPGEENYKVNPGEARSVARLVSTLHQLCLANQHPWQPARQVGIIVPFRGQIALIRQQLEALGVPAAESITIDTVERYQGSQRDVIVFSTVVSQPALLEVLSAPVETDGRPIDRKLNVAITRAREQFFLVGHLSLLRQAPDYANLLAYMQ